MALRAHRKRLYAAPNWPFGPHCFRPAMISMSPLCSSAQQRGELRHDGVIVVARIGDQRLGEGNADTAMLRSIPVTFSAGVRAMSRNGQPLAGSFSFQRIRPSRSLVRRSSFGASSA
jgi:hypothetical protein